MKKEYWFRKLVQQCENIGTYKEHFNPVIDTLAQILEDRDAARQQYIDNGAKPIIDRHTERSGEVNKTKNPSLMLINDLNTQALAYWRELCLTPKSFKDFKAENEEQTISLNDILKNIGNGKQA